MHFEISELRDFEIFQGPNFEILRLLDFEIYSCITLNGVLNLKNNNPLRQRNPKIPKFQNQ